MNRPFVHPAAIVDTAAVGEGTRIWAFAQVMDRASIGCNCNIGSHAFIESGASIGNNVTVKNHVCVWDGVCIEDDVFVGPMVTFTNDLYPRSPRMPEAQKRYDDSSRWLVPTLIQRGASLGANATILAGCRIGAYSMIAAGAVVTTDVEPFSLMVGCPAKRIAFVCYCGQPLRTDSQPAVCLHCDTTLDLPSNNSHAGRLTHDRTLP